jgi:hypothetical protein
MRGGQTSSVSLSTFHLKYKYNRCFALLRFPFACPFDITFFSAQFASQLLVEPASPSRISLSYFNIIRSETLYSLSISKPRYISKFKMLLPTKTLLALLPFFLRARAGASGTGTTTRYWDYCKPSCAWSGKADLLSGSGPVTSDDISDNSFTDVNAQSGCNGGSAYMCSDQFP